MKPPEALLNEIFHHPYAGDEIKRAVAGVQTHIKHYRAKIQRQREVIRNMEARR